MATPKRLRVFRTPIGFHDAYVAVPSRAAALRAWGTERDLFARGAAEEVTDPALVADALARPGEVIKRSRGTAAEQMAALPERASKPKSKPATRTDPQPTREPEPDRTPLIEAEQAVADSERRAARVLRKFDDRAEALVRERRAAERAARDEQRRLDHARERAATAYETAMTRWREGAR